MGVEGYQIMSYTEGDDGIPGNTHVVSIEESSPPTSGTPGPYHAVRNNDVLTVKITYKGISQPDQPTNTVQNLTNPALPPPPDSQAPSIVKGTFGIASYGQDGTSITRAG